MDNEQKYSISAWEEPERIYKELAELTPRVQLSFPHSDGESGRRIHVRRRR